VKEADASDKVDRKRCFPVRKFRLPDDDDKWPWFNVWMVAVVSGMGGGENLSYVQLLGKRFLGWSCTYEDFAEGFVDVCDLAVKGAVEALVGIRSLLMYEMNKSPLFETVMKPDRFTSDISVCEEFGRLLTMAFSQLDLECCEVLESCSVAGCEAKANKKDPGAFLTIVDVPKSGGRVVDLGLVIAGLFTVDHHDHSTWILGPCGHLRRMRYELAEGTRFPRCFLVMNRDRRNQAGRDQSVIYNVNKDGPIVIPGDGGKDPAKFAVSAAIEWRKDRGLVCQVRVESPLRQWQWWSYDGTNKQGRLVRNRYGRFSASRSVVALLCTRMDTEPKEGSTV